MGLLMELCLDLRVRHSQEFAAGGGQRVNALFLDLVRGADGAMSSRLHDMKASKPYTVSPLIGEMEPMGRGRLMLRPGKPYRLRFTMLDDELIDLWREGLLPGLQGRILRLGEVDFKIIEARDKIVHADDLYRECIVSRKAPPRRVALAFMSPTAFRSGGYNALFPLPRLIWQSANRAWSEVSRVDFGDDIHLLADGCVHASRFDLSTHILHFDRSRQLGVVGSCEYMLATDDHDLRRALHLLARFCEYAGLGMKTTMGMGQVRFGGARGGGEKPGAPAS